MNGSRRSSINNAITELLKTIDGSGSFNSNVNGNVTPKLKFWDEYNDFPAISCSSGPEYREYKPGGVKFGTLTTTIRLYVHQENPQDALELLISDVEKLIDLNQNLRFDASDPCGFTISIDIFSIITDEGLLDPYGVGEITLKVNYQVL